MVWLAVIMVLFLLVVLIYSWMRTKRTQEDFNHIQEILQEKDTIHQQELHSAQDALQVKDSIHQQELHSAQETLQVKEKEYQAQILHNIALETQKDLLEAKYIKKLKAAEEKKKNLAKYRKNKRECRKHKTLEEKVADIVGSADKWILHSSSSPKSHKIGKPLGGKGGGRPRPTIIHKEIDLHPTHCDQCGLDLAGRKSSFGYDSIITELFHELDDVGCYTYRRLENIKKNVYRKKCPDCRKWVLPELGLFANARFGVAFVCYIISKRIETRMPYRSIIHDAHRDFGNRFTLSETAIIDWFKKFEDQLKDMHDQLKEMLNEEVFQHIDETGVPMNGENWWLWVLCTANIVLFKLSESRGHQSIEDIIKNFEGTIIADFFSAYGTFKDNEHQKCLAHLLSSIIEIVVKREKENARINKKLDEHNRAFQADEDAKNPNVQKKKGRSPKLEKLSKKELTLLHRRQKENFNTLRQGIKLGKFFKQPFDPKSPFGWENTTSARMSQEEAQQQMMVFVEGMRAEGVKSEDIRKILDRCVKFQDSLFTYLDNPRMPPDNNRAERDLRPFAVQRRVSGGFKSPPLMKNFAIFLSLYMTCKANAKDFEILLTRVLSKEGVDLRSFLFAPPQ